jgi:hypothetical protein
MHQGRASVKHLLSHVEGFRDSKSALKFAKMVLQHFGSDERLEMDGGEFQDMAEKAGVIRWETYDPEKHGEHYDVEDGDQVWVSNLESEAAESNKT